MVLLPVQERLYTTVLENISRIFWLTTPRGSKIWRVYRNANTTSLRGSQDAACVQSCEYKVGPLRIMVLGTEGVCTALA